MKQNSISNPFDAKQATELISLLANETRLIIICTLLNQKCEITVNELLDVLPKEISPSYVSQQLKVLKDHELVFNRKNMQFVYYRIADHNSLKVVNLLHDIFCSNLTGIKQSLPAL